MFVQNFGNLSAAVRELSC